MPVLDARPSPSLQPIATALSISLCVHGGIIALALVTHVHDAPSESAAPWNEQTIVFESLPLPTPPATALDPTPPATLPPQPLATLPPPPPPPPPPLAPQPEELALGIDDGSEASTNWIGYRDYLEHLAQRSETDQAARRLEASGSGGRSSESLPPNEPSPATLPSPAIPAVPALPPTPANPTPLPKPEEAAAVASQSPSPNPAANEPPRLVPATEGPTEEGRTPIERPGQDGAQERPSPSPSPGPSPEPSPVTAVPPPADRPTDPNASPEAPSQPAATPTKASDPTLPLGPPTDPIPGPNPSPIPNLTPPSTLPLTPPAPDAGSGPGPIPNAIPPAPQSTSPADAGPVLPPPDAPPTAPPEEGVKDGVGREIPITVPSPLAEESLDLELPAPSAQPQPAPVPTPITNAPAFPQLPTPVQPSLPATPSTAGPPGNDLVGDGEIADSESDATSVISVPPNQWKNGRPIAAKGLTIKTRKPRFTILTMVTSSPRNPVVEITFDREGKPKNFRVAVPSGYKDIDGPILDALAGWRASGKPLDELKPNDTITLRIRLLLVQ